MIRVPVAGALIVAAGLLLAACEAKLGLSHPHVKIDTGHHSGGYHCPPGQAKKGNC